MFDAIMPVVLTGTRPSSNKRVYYFAKRVAQTVTPEYQERPRDIPEFRPSIRVMLRGAPRDEA